MANDDRNGGVEIRVFPTTPIALLVHRGAPSRIGDSIRQFIAWRKQHALPPRLSATFNILYDDPATTTESEFRLGLGAATRRSIAENPEGVVASEIPGGRCAVLRHIGGDGSLFQAVKYLYATWLPESGEELRDFPMFLQRVRFFPEVAESAAESHVFLPLR